MSKALADGLLMAFERIRSRIRPNTTNWLDWLSEQARPPAGIELRSADGSLYTGIAVFDRSKIVVMLAVRTDHDGSFSSRQPFVSPAPSNATNGLFSRREHHLAQDDGDVWPPSYQHR